MKILFLCFFAISFSRLKAQDLAGSWEGAIPVGNVDLHIVFNVVKNAGNSYSSTLDSPDQKAFGIPCSKTTLVNDSLHIEIAVIGASYNGLWDKKGNIAGTYQQGGKPVTLNLKHITETEKTALSKEPERPQTPKPPFSYVSEEVEYDNAGKSQHYGATFTKPKGEGKFPAVIIISGSGTQDRDGTLFGHKLYWVLADYLTRNGIAVLRVDDRGAGKSSLGSDIKNATSLDFSYDVEASLNYLETRTDVSKKHIGLIGHSEGGIIAPMVAARRKDISFIVLWGAPAIGGARINTLQNAYQLKKQGLDSLAVNAFAGLNDEVLALFSGSESENSLDARIGPVFDNWKKVQSPQTLAALHATNLVATDLYKQYNMLYDKPWWRFFISYDPATDLARVKCSVLAVNGEKDTQVYAKDNLGRIEHILHKSGNRDFKIMAIPNLNHLLQTAATGDVSEYESITETLSPVALNIISGWIKIHTK